MADIDLFEARFAAAYRAYLSEAPTEVDAAAVARSAAAAHPPVRLPSLWPAGNLRPIAWILLLAALLVALAATLYIGWRQRTENNLVPTGIEVLTSGGGADYEKLVVDGKGVLWASQSGPRLARLSPANAALQTWTVSDDAAFSTPEIAAANAGGVWLVTATGIRRFDGDSFRETIEPPPARFHLPADGPGKTFWAASDRSVWHWDGATWTELIPDGRLASQGSMGNVSISDLAADPAGGVWIYVATGQDDGGLVAYFDGVRWREFGQGDCPPLAAYDRSIDILPNGDVWVSTWTGLARWDGTSWTCRTADESRSPFGVAADAAGKLVLIEGQDTGTGQAAAWQLIASRLDDQSYAAREARPWGPLDTDLSITGPVSTQEGVFMALDDQLLRYADGRWARVPLASAPKVIAPPPMRSPLIVAVSHEEAWVGTDSPIHFSDGVWREEAPGSGALGQLTAMDVAANGTVWATGDLGAGYYRDGQWTIVDDRPASALALDRDGMPWLGDGGDFGNGCAIWTLRSQAGAWTRRDIAGCPLDHRIVMSLAIDVNGDVWVGGGGYVGVGLAPHGIPGNLARFDGQTWTRVDEVNDIPIESSSVASVPGGDEVLLTIDHVYPDSWYASPETYPQPFDAYLFDGTSWAPVAMPADRSTLGGQPFMAPDGTVWASSVNSPARYDGQAWQFPYADLPAAAVPIGGPHSVAPDGTMFTLTGTDVIRLPEP